MTRARHSRPQDPIRAAVSLNRSGVRFKELGRPRKAERCYRRALLLLRTPAKYPELAATLHHNLAGALHAQGRFSLALPIARRGLALRRAMRPGRKAALAADHAAFAAILVELRSFRRARALYRAALCAFRQEFGAHHYEVGATVSALGALEARAGRWRAAERFLRRGARILEDALGSRHPRLIAPLNNLAVACVRKGSPAEAAACYRRALRALPAGRAQGHIVESVIRANLRQLTAIVEPRRRARKG